MADNEYGYSGEAPLAPKKEEAKKKFEDIEKTNPDNQEIKLILSNIQAGKDPFSNAKPPITSRPENREKLPLEQKN